MAGNNIVLKKGLGKDGSRLAPYVRDHPTNYSWRPDVERLTHRLVNDDRFRRKIWLSTYFRHPPGEPGDDWKWRDRTSFDVWGFGGRGDPLPLEIGRRVFHEIFNGHSPSIWWAIYRGRMYTRTGGWGPAPPGPAGSDAGHWRHIHITFVDA